MAYTVRLTPGARSDLEGLDSEVRRRVIAKLGRLAESFDELNPEPLSADWRGYYKLRVGDWRVIYKPNRETKTITVYRVAHQREVYL